MKAIVLGAFAAACGGSGVAVTGDAPIVDGAGSIDASLASRCTTDAMSVTCTSEAATIGGRTVTYQVPLGAPPAAGWPAVVFYQGSFVAGSRTFAATTADLFGAYQLTLTVKALLDRGYAVIAPNSLANGSAFWETNVPPYSTAWMGCEDDVFVDALLAALAGFAFGPLDSGRRYAMGISSGGYMTSRMAVSYAGQFRALAVASASYATCGKTCTVPTLPPDHPPTLFLHGATDTVVPISTMTPYRDALVADGRVASAVVDPNAGHEWLAEAVAAVPAWFDAH